MRKKTTYHIIYAFEFERMIVYQIWIHSCGCLFQLLLYLNILVGIHNLTVSISSVYLNLKSFHFTQTHLPFDEFLTHITHIYTWIHKSIFYIRERWFFLFSVCFFFLRFSFWLFSYSPSSPFSWFEFEIFALSLFHENDNF